MLEASAGQSPFPVALSLARAIFHITAMETVKRIHLISPLTLRLPEGGIFTMFPLKSLGGKTIKGVLAKWKHWFISSFGACSYSS